MKIVLGFIFMMINMGTVQAKNLEYICTAVDEADQTDFRLKIFGAHGPMFTVSDISETASNTAVIDEVYVSKNPGSDYKRLKSLDGGFSSLGDNGDDTYRVELFIDKSVIRGADDGYIKYRAHGSDGYEAVTYKRCRRTVKI